MSQAYTQKTLSTQVNTFKRFTQEDLNKSSLFLPLINSQPEIRKPAPHRTQQKVIQPTVKHFVAARPIVEKDLLRTIFVRMKTTSFMIKLTIFSTADVYRFVDKQIRTWQQEQPAYANKRVLKVTCYFNGKPLSRRAIALAEYNIHDNDIINLETHIGLGGFSPLDFVGGMDGATKLLWQHYISSHSYHKDINSDDIMKITEATFILFRQIQIANSKEAAILACCSFLHITRGKSIASQVNAIIKEVSQMISNLFAENIDTLSVQSDENGNPFSNFRKYFVMFEQGINHPILTKLKDIFFYLLANAFLEPFGIKFDKFHFTKAAALAHKLKYSSHVGFAYCVLDGFTFIFERLYDVYKTGSWNAIIHSGKSYSQWIDLVYSIKEDIQKLHNPEACGVEYHELLNRIDRCIEEGDAILKYAPAGKTGDEKAMIKKLLSEIRVIQAGEFTRKASQEEREAPFGALLYGGSNVGKSSLASIMYQHFGKLHNLPATSEYKYNRCFSEKFWSSFRTSMWYIQLDDAAARKANLQDDISLDEILHIINNVGYTPPQADLADKGKTPLRPKLVIATTNVKHLNAHVYFENTLAILRRFKFYVEVYPKQQYSVNKVSEEGSRVLDTSSLPPISDTEYPNYWEFKIYNVVCKQNNGSQSGALELSQKIDDINVFLALYSELTIKHFDLQKKAMLADKSFANIEICKKCYIPLNACTCQNVQCYDTLATMAVGIAGFMYSNPQISKPILQAVANAGIKHISPYVVKAVKSQICKEVTTRLDEIRNKVNTTAYDVFERLKYECDKLKTIMHGFGNYTRAFYEKHKMKLAILACIPFILFLYKTYGNFSRVLSQGNEISKVRYDESQDTSKIFKHDEKANPWVNNDYVVSDFDVGRYTSSLKGTDIHVVRERIAKNCAYIESHYNALSGAKIRIGRAVCLGGNIYMTNNHNLPEDVDITLKVTSNPVREGITQNVSVLLTQSEIRRFPKLDIAFFRIMCVSPKSSIIEFLSNENFNTICNGYFIQKTATGITRNLAIKSVKFCKNVYVDTFSLDFSSWMGTIVENTVNGDCGSVILGTTPLGPVILGLHQTGGNRNQFTAVAVNKTMLEPIQDWIDCMFSPTKPKLRDIQGNEVQIEPLHYKSVFRYMETGNAKVYGSLPGFRAKHSSKVTDTFIRKIVEKHGYEVKTDKPVMQGWEPWRIGALDIVQQQYKMRSDTLDACVKSFTRDIISSLSKEDKAEIVVLDDSSTLNGIPGVRFIDKMKRDTSMGYPWKKKKNQFLHKFGHVGQWQDYVQFHDEIYDEVDEIMAKYKNKERCMAIFTGHLKDEPTAFAKIDSKKTRVFAGANAPWCFVVRKHLLTFTRVLQNNKFIFESAPGTNPVSSEWGDIYRYLTQFGEDRIIAGDYSKFDKNMSSQVIMAAFEIIKNVLTHCGWSKEDLQIVTGISYDTAFPVMDFNGDLVEFFGSNPSGQPLTVIINGLVNSLYVRYVWATVGNDLNEFKNNVALMTYGDDNIMGVNRNIDNFDHTVMQKILSEVNVKYTMADKLAESVPFIHIKDASFLKRSWRYESELGDYQCPIEEDSIAKSLTKCLPSSELCPEQHAISVLNNAVFEYFNYGKAIFHKKREMCLQIVKEADLELFYVNQPFPTWNELADAFRERG